MHLLPTSLLLLVCAAHALSTPKFTPKLVEQGRELIVAQSAPSIPLGLYTMLHFHMDDPSYNQQALIDIVGNRDYLSGIALEIYWEDLQPTNAPPSGECLSNFTRLLNYACAVHHLPARCMKVFLKPYMAWYQPAWTWPIRYNDSKPVLRNNSLDMQVVTWPWPAPKPPHHHPKHGRTHEPVELDFEPMMKKKKAPSHVASFHGRQLYSPVSTDPLWQYQIHILLNAVDSWLTTNDPNATFVPMIHFVGPVMESLTMRIYRGLQPYFPANGTDLLGAGWTLESHLAAWKEMASNYSRYTAFNTRYWVFDAGVIPPAPGYRNSMSVTVDQQVEIINALRDTHPLGPDAVIAKTESLMVDHIDVSQGCGKKNHHSFRVGYAQPGLYTPYQWLVQQPYHHAWEDWAPLEHGNKHVARAVPGMYPMKELIENALFSDLNASTPSKPAGALWAEIWSWESFNTSAEAACVPGPQLHKSLVHWNNEFPIQIKKKLKDE